MSNPKDQITQDEISIVPAGPEHLPAITALADVVWRAHYPGIITIEQIDYMLARMYNLAVLQEELGQGIRYDRLLVGGQLRGFASYGPWHGDQELKLYKIYIHPEWQRRGLGTLLLRHVEQAGRKRGFRLVLLTVNKRNDSAVAAYRKNGFTVREAVVTDIGSGFVMDDYIMVKPL